MSASDPTPSLTGAAAASTAETRTRIVQTAELSPELEKTILHLRTSNETAGLPSSLRQLRGRDLPASCPKWVGSFQGCAVACSLAGGIESGLLGSLSSKSPVQVVLSLRSHAPGLTIKVTEKTSGGKSTSHRLTVRARHLRVVPEAGAEPELGFARLQQIPGDLDAAFEQDLEADGLETSLAASGRVFGLDLCFSGWNRPQWDVPPQELDQIQGRVDQADSIGLPGVQDRVIANIERATSMRVWIEAPETATKMDIIAVLDNMDHLLELNLAEGSNWWYRRGLTEADGEARVPDWLVTAWEIDESVTGHGRIVSVNAARPYRWATLRDDSQSMALAEAVDFACLGVRREQRRQTANLRQLLQTRTPSGQNRTLLASWWQVSEEDPGAYVVCFEQHDEENDTICPPPVET